MTTRVTLPSMDKFITTTSYTASGVTAAAGYFSLDTIVLLIGLLFAALTFLLNWWYQHRKYVLDLEHHQARMQQFSNSPAAEDLPIIDTTALNND